MRPEQFDEALPASGSITSISGKGGAATAAVAVARGTCAAAILIDININTLIILTLMPRHQAASRIQPRHVSS